MMYYFIFTPRQTPTAAFQSINQSIKTFISHNIIFVINHRNYEKYSHAPDRTQTIRYLNIYMQISYRQVIIIYILYK